MTRFLCALLALISAGAMVGSSTASAAPTWRLEQPAPAPPPEGVAAPAFGVPLGAVQDIQFWSPNRGLMAVAENSNLPIGTVSEGLYTWDGNAWTLYSTVCSGGQNTRIAWAGPTEFWTIADASEAAKDAGLQAASTLCHFKDGVVVGSYATLRSDANAYQTMSGGACNGPNDCWFAGGPMPAPRVGAFHLHWDGTTLSTVEAPQGRPVRDVESFGGAITEAVAIQEGSRAPTPNAPEPVPALIHRIAGGASTADGILNDPFMPDPIVDRPADATELTALDADQQRLWVGGIGAVTGPNADFDPLRGPLVAVQELGGQLRELTLKPALAPGIVVIDVAAEPGGQTAWFSLRDDADENATGAAVAQVDASGAVLQKLTLPLPGDSDPNAKGSLGDARRIACAAVGDCWLATSEGWLFHLTDGTRQPTDVSPAFQKLITERPRDGSSPQLVPDSAPTDDSGDTTPFVSAILPAPEEPAAEEEPVSAPRATKVKVRALSRTRIEVSFRLTLRARVKLVASYRKRVVASTPRRTMKAGPHKLQLRVTAKRWPTKIDLSVVAPK